MCPLICCILARYLRYAEKIILGISNIYLCLFFSYALASNQNPCKLTDSYIYNDFRFSDIEKYNIFS